MDTAAALDHSAKRAHLKKGSHVNEKSSAGLTAEGGEDRLVSYKTATTWFKNSKEENYNLDDKSHSGRSRLDIDDDITDVLEDEPRSSILEVSSHTGPSFATIFRHQKEYGRTAEYRQVISQELTDSQLKRSCDLSQSLLRRSLCSVASVVLIRFSNIVLEIAE
ncbi:CRE-UGT-51 protein [Caenorhabditis remanei]|uniref:CRE-UGT-51 protein n=1 Tax=Caenorhabditis remanei TaxID=31234 RepID=E3N4V0_CAERE|nr:CRE-UGT-51 protein [Caenorhabditis remanei]